MAEDKDKRKNLRKDKLAQQSAAANRRTLDLRLDLFERKIEALKVTYEQYFLDIIVFPPDKEHAEVKKMKKDLLAAPFKQVTHSFRLRQLITRYQTYDTYWVRTLKAREGRYSRDVFKAELRQKEMKEAKRAATASGAAEKGFKQLFDSYENAIKKSGGNADNIDYGAFKRSLVNQAQALKKKGVKKLSYKIVMKDGKAVVKAIAKKK